MPLSIAPSMNPPQPLAMSEPANRIRPWAACMAGRWAERKPVRCIGQVSPDSGSPTQSWLATATTSTPGTWRSSCEARRRPELADAVSTLYEKYVSALADGLMASGLTRNVQVVARTLFASLDGLVLQYLAGVERDLIAASLEEVHDVLLLRAGAGGKPRRGLGLPAAPPCQEHTG